MNPAIVRATSRNASSWFAWTAEPVHLPFENLPYEILKRRGAAG